MERSISQQENAEKQERPVGIIKRTLVSSPVIKKILRFRSSSGDVCLIIIRDRSIEVNSKKLELSSTVRNAELLPIESQEDLLLLSLASGWLLLVKVYCNGDIPLVVEKTRIGDRYKDAVSSLGHEAQSDWLGRAFAVTALQGHFRIYSLTTVKDGQLYDTQPGKIKEEYTISLPGCTILGACFLHPLKESTTEQHVLYLVLYSTADCRLKLTLYEWWTNRRLSTFQEYGTLPLDLPLDELPLFMVPVSCEDIGVVLVMRTKAYLVTCHDILSGNVRLSVFKEIENFPVAYYKEPLPSNSSNINWPLNDVFFLCAEIGIIYIVHASIKGLSIEPLINVKLDLGSSFIIQPYDRISGVLSCPVIDSSTLLITYGGDLSGGGSFIADIIGEEEQGSDEEMLDNEEYEGYRHFTEAKENFDNWAPINDFQAVSGRSSFFTGTCLYACIGQNKTGAICNLSYGLKATLFQEGTKMEGVNKMFSIQSQGPLEEEDDQKSYYMIISSPWSTDIFEMTINEFGYPELENVSAECGLRVTESETLAIDFIPHTDYVLQVTNDEIIISDMNGKSESKSIDRTSVVSLCGNYLVIASPSAETTQQWKITLFKAHPEINDWVEQVGYQILTDNDISVVKLSTENKDGKINCFFGTRKPSILKYVVEESNGLTYEREFVNVFPEVPDSIPNDITCLKNNDQCELLVGLRNGVCLMFDETSGRVEMSKKIGEIPVEFVTCHQKEFIFLKNGQLSALNGFSKELHRVVFDFTHLPDVSTLCPLSIESDPIGNNAMLLAVVVNKTLQIVRMYKNPQMVTKKTDIGATPKRMVYLEHLSVFGVAIQASRKRRERGSYQLEFFTLKKLEPATSNGPLVYGHRKSASTSDSSETEKLVFSPDESVYSLSEWSVTQNGKKYKYVLVGSGFDTSKRGKIRILRVYRNKDNGLIEVVRQYSQDTDGPVYAIAGLSGSAIVYSTVNLQTSESRVHVNLMEEDSKHVFRMTKYSSNPLKGPVIQLSTEGDSIFASTVKNSVFVLHFQDGKIEICHGDGVARATVNHTSIGEDYILVSDKNQLFTGLRRAAPGKVTLETMFKLELPSVIVKTRQVDYRLVFGQEKAEPRRNTYISAGVGGALYGFQVINGEEFQSIHDRIFLEEENGFRVAASEGDRERSEHTSYSSEDGGPLYRASCSSGEPEPLYPGITWQDELMCSTKVIDGDDLERKYGRKHWISDMLT